MINKTILYVAALAVLGLFSTVLEAQISLAPGMRMPSFEADWVRTPKPFFNSAGPVSGNPAPEKKSIMVMTMADALSPDFIRTMRMLESLDSSLRHEKRAEVRTAVVVRNDAQILKRVLDSERNPLALAIGSDKTGHTYREFGTAVTSMPCTFVSVNGQLVWSGHPMEVQNVIRSNIDGTFSLSKQNQIIRYRKQLQTALRTGLPSVAAQTADRILDLSPADSIALQAKLYAYETTGDRPGAVKFLETHLKKNPAISMQLRMLLLDQHLRSGNLLAWKKEVSPATEDAMRNPGDALNLAAYLLDSAPAAALPVKEIFRLSGKASGEFAKDADMADLYADSLEISAKANYRACRLDRAIEDQKKACEIRKKISDPHTVRAEEFLRFYQSLKESFVR